MKINVIDSIMGSGKTTWAINKINNSINDKFIYITPYLDEIKRVKNKTNHSHKMHDPVYKGGSKTNHFHQMLIDGKSVCSTHALLQGANQITREALALHDYTLILDEVMDVIEQMPMTQDDIKMLFDQRLVYVEDDYLLWHPDAINYQGKFENVKNMALNRNVIFIGERLMFWNFPVDIFKYFKEVYILTYLFDAQLQRYYYDFHDIQYTKYQINDDYQLIPFTTDKEIADVSRIKHLINIYEGKLNRIGDNYHSLSKSWFERHDKTMETVLKKNLVNWFNNINKGNKSEHRLWTTFKDIKARLNGKGYSKRFVALNIRATNDYINSSVLAYCCNRFAKPTIKLFFHKRGIAINEDLFAISEMIQWIWRSQIRIGEPINIYIPSQRMRELLKRYLGL